MSRVTSLTSPNNKQLTRILIVLGIVLLLAIVGFGGYYWYDRYYRPQPKVADATVQQAEQAVASDPQNLEKRLALADAYMTSGRWDDAIARANEVLAIEPEDPEMQQAWLIIGVSNALQGKYSDAIDPLSKLVEARKDGDMPGLDPQLKAAAYYLGDSYLQLNDPKSAVAPLEQAVKWSQTDADSMYKLGLAYAGTGEDRKAADMFYAATTLVPDFLEAYEGLADAYTKLEMPALATYARGMMAYSKKDYAAARDLLLQASQAQTDYAPIFAGLGRTYEGLDDLQAATTAYENALKIDPSNFTATSGLQRVQAMMQQ